MGGGPPEFLQDFTCPAVLWIPLAVFRFHIRGFHSLWLAFPKPFYYPSTSFMWSVTPMDKSIGLGSFPFARRYLGNRCFFLFLRLLRCFSSPGSLCMAIRNFSPFFTRQRLRFAQPGFPIQKSAGHKIFAPNRSLSQLITSFIGS